MFKWYKTSLGIWFLGSHTTFVTFARIMPQSMTSASVYLHFFEVFYYIELNEIDAAKEDISRLAEMYA